MGEEETISRVDGDFLCVCFFLVTLESPLFDARRPSSLSFSRSYASLLVKIARIGRAQGGRFCKFVAILLGFRQNFPPLRVEKQQV